MSSPNPIIYLASDFHLGAPNIAESKAREMQIVSWLDHVATDATEIYLVGDVFDFWFEYKKVIPKGFTRLLGKICELSDKGIKIHFFLGNHDMWIKDYFKEEFNADIHKDAIERIWYGKIYLLGHGDGLGPGDRGYKFIKRILRSPLCQWAFARLHPNFGVGLAQYFSQKSRIHGKDDSKYSGPENEWLYLYAQETLEQKHIDYFVFGHRHLPLCLPVKESIYFNLGEWINYNTYLRIDENGPSMLKWTNHSSSPYVEDVS